MVLFNSSLVLAILLFEAGIEIIHNGIQSSQVLVYIKHCYYHYHHHHHHYHYNIALRNLNVSVLGLCSLFKGQKYLKKDSSYPSHSLNHFPGHFGVRSVLPANRAHP